MASSSTMLMMKTNLKTKNNVKRGRTFKTNLTHTFMTKELIFLPLLSAFFIFVWWCSFGLIRCCFHYCHLSFFFLWWCSFGFIRCCLHFSVLHVFVITFLTSMTEQTFTPRIPLSYVIENFYTKDTTFICYWKLSQNSITALQILYINTILHVKKDIFSPCFYGYISNKAKKLKSDLSIPLWGRFTLLTVIDN